MALHSDLSSPSHDIDLLRSLCDTRVSKDLVHSVLIDSPELLPVLLFRDHVVHAGVGISARIQEDPVSVSFVQPLEHIFDEDHVVDVVLGLEVVLGEHGHPDLVEVRGLRHEQRRPSTAQVERRVAVRLVDPEQVVEVALLVERVVYVRVVHWYVCHTFEEGNRVHFGFFQGGETEGVAHVFQKFGSVLFEERVWKTFLVRVRPCILALQHFIFYQI